jgi:hypothetical protein
MQNDAFLLLIKILIVQMANRQKTAQHLLLLVLVLLLVMFCSSIIYNWQLERSISKKSQSKNLFGAFCHDTFVAVYQNNGYVWLPTRLLIKIAPK